MSDKRENAERKQQMSCLGVIVVTGAVMYVTFQLGFCPLSRIRAKGILIIKGIARMAIHGHRIERSQAHPEETTTEGLVM